MTLKNSFKWDANDYARHSSAQLSWANELIGKLALTGTESVLDIGCGDGKITARIAESLPDGHISGIDSSKEMIELAKKTFPEKYYPNLSFVMMDARSISFSNRFDMIFSTAALHWITDHKPVLKKIKNCIKPGGHILLQMGGKGNADAILTLLGTMIKEHPWQSYFQNFSFAYGFHDVEIYTSWLKQAGLVPQRVELIPKVMSYDDRQGLAGWIRTTWLPYIDRIPTHLKKNFVAQLVDTYIACHPFDKKGKIHVDMVRLEVEASSQ
ncbi:MAG: methyltransferase domain-containing protein [Proteobacteria bacterium]|nr:methyltransferase domain-containing protein [Pseudomonadota bacterium]MBU1582418.1 methyltransferase domain-containing protein [Pseudomonadota bacterium]MBU2453498.1 methyltransferase domain-containing protein [Pseudomonadota bacterium]MBU2628921.1 methyltransferase domain-containing protein [Pseudomonadota bacterium]